MTINDLVAAGALQALWLMTLLPAALTSGGTARAGCLARGCAFVVSRRHRGLPGHQHGIGQGRWKCASSRLCRLSPCSMPVTMASRALPSAATPNQELSQAHQAQCTAWQELFLHA